MTVTGSQDAAPGTDIEELGGNEFNAGRVLSLHCMVNGHTGNLTYTWSVTGNPETPGCSNCAIGTSSTTSALVLSQLSLNSYHAGTYTCTVSESGRADSENSDDLTVVVVGKRVFTVMIRLSYMNNASCIGAGVYAVGRTSGSEFANHPISNNGLIVSGSNGLRLECVSNSSQSGVGTLTAYDGGTLPIGSNTGVWRLVNPFSRPGVLRLQTKNTASITPSDQGIYTCSIPDSNNNEIVLNFGLYPHGFIGE